MHKYLWNEAYIVCVSGAIARYKRWLCGKFKEIPFPMFVLYIHAGINRYTRV